MKRLFSWVKTHKIVSVLGTLVVATIVYQILKPATPPTYITETASKQTLLQTVDASAEVRSGSKVELAFQTSGRVGSVFVREGDAVLPGQQLALLDTTALFAGSTTSPLAEASAVILANTSGVTTPGSPASIALAETQVVSATTTLELARVDLAQAKLVRDATIAEMEIAQAKAERELQDLRMTLTQSSEEVRQDFAGVLQGNVIALRSTLADADTVLGITSPLANDDLEDVLSLTNEQLLTSAVNAYVKALSTLQRVEAPTFTLSDTSSYAEIEPVIAQMTQALAQTGSVLLFTRQTLDATTIDTQAFSFEDLTAKKSLIDTARDAIRLEQDALETQTQLRANTTLNQNKQLNASEFALQSAKQALQKTHVVQDQAMTKAEASVKNAVASLEQQLATAYQTIGSTEGALRDAQIVSPIEGVVTKIEMEPGEFKAAGTTTITVQSVDASTFELTADLAEADVSKVAVGQPVDVELDAYGSTQTFPAQVASVDLSEKVVEGVVFYEAVLFFTAPESLPTIKPGMTANVIILVNQFSEILSVPQRAVQTHDGGTFIRIKKEDIVTETPVTLGQRADGGRVEILDGLSEGDVIVVSIQ